MILAVVETDRVAKTCPREFLRLRLDMAQADIDLSKLALILDQLRTDRKPSRKIDKRMDTVIGSYDKLTRKFKRVHKVEVQLTKKGSWDSSETPNWMRKKDEVFFDKDGKVIPKEKYADFVWTVPIKVPKFYKEVGIELVERK